VLHIHSWIPQGVNTPHCWHSLSGSCTHHLTKSSSGWAGLSCRTWSWTPWPLCFSTCNTTGDKSCCPHWPWTENFAISYCSRLAQGQGSSPWTSTPILDFSSRTNFTWWAPVETGACHCFLLVSSHYPAQATCCSSWPWVHHSIRPQLCLLARDQQPGYRLALSMLNTGNSTLVNTSNHNLCLPYHGTWYRKTYLNLMVLLIWSPLTTSVTLTKSIAFSTSSHPL